MPVATVRRRVSEVTVWRWPPARAAKRVAGRFCPKYVRPTARLLVLGTTRPLTQRCRCSRTIIQPLRNLTWKAFPWRNLTNAPSIRARPRTRPKINTRKSNRLTNRYNFPHLISSNGQKTPRSTRAKTLQWNGPNNPRLKVVFQCRRCHSSL